MTVGFFLKYLTSISLRHTNILYKSGSLLTEKFVGGGGNPKLLVSWFKELSTRPFASMFLF